MTKLLLKNLKDHNVKKKIKRPDIIFSLFYFIFFYNWKINRLQLYIKNSFAHLYDIP